MLDFFLGQLLGLKPDIRDQLVIGNDIECERLTDKTLLLLILIQKHTASREYVLNF